MQYSYFSVKPSGVHEQLHSERVKLRHKNLPPTICKIFLYLIHKSPRFGVFIHGAQSRVSKQRIVRPSLNEENMSTRLMLG